MPATRPTIQRLDSLGAEDLQRRAAAALMARGLELGDRIVIIGSTSAAMLTVILGALRVGIVPVLINQSLLPREQEDLIADATPRLVLRGADLPALLDTGARADLAPYPLARPMHYTSGTSGRPKGVWSGILDERAAEALVREERDLWSFDSSDRHLVCSPLHHSAPLRFASGTLLAGGEVVLLSHFDAETVLDLMVHEKLSTTFCVPAHLQRLFELAPSPIPTSMRLVVHAGAPCPPSLKRGAIDAFPRRSVWEFYGSTEGQFTACSSDEWLEKPGTVGRARPGRRLSISRDHTVWCEAPEHARFEYWRDPEKTRAAWRGNAFSVGDLGSLDPDGYLFLDGRRDDLIISGGVNVYPIEVEHVIAHLPGVSAVAVFGRDDERWGQRVCAAVVGDTTPEAVIEGCRRELAAYKCPKEVVMVDQIPTTVTGKRRRWRLARDLNLEPVSE